MGSKNQNKRNLESERSAQKSAKRIKSGEISSHENSCEIMIQWGRENGAFIDNILLQEPSDNFKDDHKTYRGAYAKKRISPNEIVASIPEKLIITETICRASQPGRALEKYLEKHPERMAKLTDVDPFACSVSYMVAFMIYERFENLSGDESALPSASFFAPYLCALPETYSLPLWWPEEMVDKELGGTNLHFIVQERRRLLREMLGVVTEACEDQNVYSQGSLTWQNFLWAYSAISSRAFPKQKSSLNGSANKPAQNHSVDPVFPVIGNSDQTILEGESIFSIGNPRVEECEVCMWPILDMLNHKTGQKMEWNGTGGDVKFVTQQELRQGEELFNNYGPKGNENFLSNYGFCLDPNPADYVKLKLSLAPPSGADENLDTDLHSARLLLLELYALYTPTTSDKPGKIFMLFSGDELPVDLLSTLRIMVADRWELEKLQAAASTTIGEVGYVSARNEASMLHTLFTMVEKKRNPLAVMVRSVEEGPLVTDEESDFRIKCARVYRRGQLSILNDAAKQIKQRFRARFSKGQLRTIVDLDPRLLEVLSYISSVIRVDENDDENDAESGSDSSSGLFDEDDVLCISILWEAAKESDQDQCWSEFFKSTISQGGGKEVAQTIGPFMDDIREHYEGLFEAVVLQLQQQSIPSRIQLDAVALGKAISFEKFLWATAIVERNRITVDPQLFGSSESSGDKIISGLLLAV
ncbi:hypothetical protein BJ742DRAFT_871969 [Cladochytrium replicatum]|nr:hypothetical protein BJ742DRAFT_871969 [Cladochytrium replicatum]